MCASRWQHCSTLSIELLELLRLLCGVPCAIASAVRSRGFGVAARLLRLLLVVERVFGVTDDDDALLDPLLPLPPLLRTRCLLAAVWSM